MRILIIHTIFSPENARGSEIIAQDTYKILKNAGQEVYYFATDKQPYLEDKEWTKYFPTFEQRFSPKWWWNTEAQRNLSEMLDEIKPDIVHIHTMWQLSYSIFKPILNRNIPIVMTVHDTGLLCPVAHGWNDIENKTCLKCKGFNTLPCIINNCIRTKKRISSFNMALSSFINKLTCYNQKISRYIIPSISLANYITTDKSFDNKKISIVPNFLNNSFLKRIQIYDKQDYFLFVGTLADYKGVNVLLDAIKELPKDIPFKIIGSGPNEDKYQQFVKENNLTNVEFLGNLDRGEIIKYYANSISLIVPSNYFEIFGMINLESFACKRPVIASNIGGIPEIVENNKNGLLFEPGNVEQLKGCILKYWNNKDLALEHGENGYKKVYEKYTEEKYYERLIGIYEEVLNGEK